MTTKRQTYASPSRHGQWYVKYPADEIGHRYETGLMTRSEARGLASIFGGTVHYLAPVRVAPKPRRPLWRILLGIK